MGIKYSKEETIKEFQEAMNIATLYNARCINWEGEAKNGDSYSEIIAEELLTRRNMVEMFSNIIPITRERSYRVGHDGETKNKTNREEEIFAKRLFEDYKSNALNKIGKIFDYQVPLKASQSDEAGKIDLVSYDESEKIVYLLELKYKDNKETLLRCALEIATYYQLLNKYKFIKDYSDDELKNSDVKDIKKGILIFKGSNQHDEVKEIESGHRPYLKKLLDELKVEIFVIDDSMEVKHIIL